MQTTAAALTMVRDDAFYLKIWLRYYGEMLGRENCYIISHGRGEEVADLAAGCNVIGIPGDPHPQFEKKRWRLLNGAAAMMLVATPPYLYQELPFKVLNGSQGAVMAALNMGGGSSLDDINLDVDVKGLALVSSLGQ